MSLRDFDDLYTAPQGGFNSGLDYYEKCSTHLFLENVRTPTVVLASKDDPFIAYQEILNAKKSNSVYLELVEHGGHMGYLNKNNTPHGNRRWMDYAVVEFVNQYFGI